MKVGMKAFSSTKNTSRREKSVVALDSINLDIADGEFVTIVGRHNVAKAKRPCSTDRGLAARKFRAHHLRRRRGRRHLHYNWLRDAKDILTYIPN